MLIVISDDVNKPYTIPTTSSTMTTSGYDFEAHQQREPVYIEIGSLPRKKKVIPKEPWRAKRKGGKGIR